MNINAVILCIFATIVVSIVTYVFFNKIYTDPLMRIKKFTESFFTSETINDRRVVVMEVYKYNNDSKCDDKICEHIIPFDFLVENKGYRVGRIQHSIHSKNLRKRIGFRFANRDLFFPVTCSMGNRSGLSSNAFTIHKLLINGDYILALQTTSTYGKGKGLYRVDDNVIVENGSYYALVPSGFKSAAFRTENNLFTFYFEMLNLDNQKDFDRLEEFRENISKKEETTKKMSLVEKFFSDASQPAMNVYSGGDTYTMRSDKTRPYMGNESTKVYVPGQSNKQKHQEYPRIL